MTTISVPLKEKSQQDLQFLLDSDYGANKADVIRRALKLAAEEEAVQRVLRAQKEPSLRGDLDTLMHELA